MAFEFDKSITADNVIKFATLLSGVCVALVLICGWLFRREYILSFGIDPVGIDSDSAFPEIAYAGVGLPVIKHLLDKYLGVSIITFITFQLLLIIYRFFERMPTKAFGLKRLIFFLLFVIILIVSLLRPEYGIFLVMLLLFLREKIHPAFFAIAVCLCVMFLFSKITEDIRVYARDNALDAVKWHSLSVVKFHVIDRALNRDLNDLNRRMQKGIFVKIFMDRKNLYVYDESLASLGVERLHLDEVRSNRKRPFEIMVVPLNKISGLTIIGDFWEGIAAVNEQAPRKEMRVPQKRRRDNNSRRSRIQSLQRLAQLDRRRERAFVEVIQLAADGHAAR
jgi:hypothetical protein